MHQQSTLSLFTSEEIRHCDGCGQPLSRRDGESPSAFRKRKTCDRACQGAARSATWERKRQELLQRGEKECSRCGEAKPLSEFNRHPKALYRAECKDCQSSYFKEWRAPRASSLNEKSRKWYRENSDHVYRYNVAYRRMAADSTVRICPRCGQEFRPTSVESRYCSLRCGRQAAVDMRRANGEFGDPVIFNCEECGKEVVDSPSRTDRRFCSQKCAAPSRMRSMASKGATSIEMAVYQALESLGVDFLRQHVIGTWAVDAYVPSLDLVIECQGDYWHCNPKVFPDGPESDIQRKGVERDRRRRRWFEARGYRYIELWESDINEFGAEHLVRNVLNYT